jgi:hypothetical protein
VFLASTVWCGNGRRKPARTESGWFPASGARRDGLWHTVGPGVTDRVAGPPR